MNENSVPPKVGGSVNVSFPYAKVTLKRVLSTEFRSNKCHYCFYSVGGCYTT